MAIGERIRFFRNLRGMTQKYLVQPFFLENAFDTAALGKSQKAAI